MKLLVIQRPVGNPTAEELAADPEKFAEPVAVLAVGGNLTEQEMNSIGLAVLEIIGDKPISTEQVKFVARYLSAL